MDNKHKTPSASEEDFQRSFYSITRLMEAEILAASVHMVWDSEVRRLYAQKISAMSSETQLRVKKGEITWK